MRVLDPRSRNPLYKIYHKTSASIGDGGTITSMLAVGTVAPIGGSLFLDSFFGLMAAGVGFLGAFSLSYNGYTKHTKTKVRISMIKEIENAVPGHYKDLIRPMVEEIYHCNRNHYEYKSTGQQNIKATYEVHKKGFSRKTQLIEETKAEWEIRQEQEKILVLGKGCSYCGERIHAAIQLRDECLKESEIDDSTSVQAAKIVLESKRQANREIEEIKSMTRQALKELT
jgi:hypothetical protein